MQDRGGKFEELFPKLLSTQENFLWGPEFEWTIRLVSGVNDENL